MEHNDRHRERQKKGEEPTVAPSLEMDDLEQNASKDEKEKGETTTVTKLYIDRIDDD